MGAASQMESGLRAANAEDDEAATKGDLSRVEEQIETLIKRTFAAGSEGNHVSQLDIAPKYMRALLKAMERVQAFDFADAKIAANQLHALAKLHPNA